MSKMNYSPRYRGYGIAYTTHIGTPRRASSGIGKHPPHKPQSRSSLLRAAQTNRAIFIAKDKPTYPDKVIPDKRDIREYCRQDARFLELDEFIAGAPKRKSHVGVSAANTERVQIKRQILDELPFGPILGDKK